MIDLDSVELSEPQFEAFGIRHVTYKSAAIPGRQDMLVILPEKGDAPLPLTLLLHGVGGSHWAWAFQGGAHRTLFRLIDAGDLPPMALALPSDGLWGDGSGYLPHGPSRDYEQLVLEVPEVAAVVDPRITSRSPLFVSGLSMGGYGALRIGGKHADRFAGISSHSAITTLRELQDFVTEDLSTVLSKSPETAVVYWLEKNAERLPPLRFDCGLDDRLLCANRLLHHQLEVLGVDHVYDEFVGGHEWTYWREHLRDSLMFFGAQLRQADSPTERREG